MARISSKVGPLPGVTERADSDRRFELLLALLTANYEQRVGAKAWGAVVVELNFAGDLYLKELRFTETTVVRALDATGGTA